MNIAGNGYIKTVSKKAGLDGYLGCGFDPGVTGVYTAYAAKHHFDEIQYLDIVDCNAGDHHKAFATNFNPEINIRWKLLSVVNTTKTESGRILTRYRYISR